MLRKWIGGCAALAVVLLAGAFAAAQSAVEFSAVIVKNVNGSPVRQKFFVGKDRMRIDPESAAGEEGAVLILDFSRGAGLVLMPAQKTFMELSGLKPNGPGGMRFLNPVDLSHPCDVLLLPGENSGKHIPCSKAGNASLNGRTSIRWTGTLPNGKEGHVWIDTRLGFLLKLETPDTSIELRDIQEAVQPPSIFEVPSGYIRLQAGTATNADQ